MLLAPITAGPASIVDSSRQLGLCGLLRKSGEQYLNLLEALEKDEAGGVALNLRCLAEQLRQITPRLRDQENQVVTMLSSLRDANKVISLRGTLVDNNDYKEFTDALSDYQKQLIAYDIQLEAEMKRQESRPKMKEAKIDQLRSKVVKMIKTSCRSDVNERDNDSKNDDPTLLDVKQITKSRLPHHQESRERLSTRTVQDDKLDEVAPDKQPVASNDDSPKVPFDLNLPKQTTLIACAKEKRSDRGTQDPLKREFYCEETAFLIYEKERRRFVCQICGSRDLGPAYIDAGPSSSWYSSFDDKNSLEFKELPVILATNISTIFNPIDVTIRPISLYALRCPTVISRNMSNNSESSSSSNLNLLAICCIAHSEPRSLICCRSKDTIRQVSGGSLDNFLRTMSSILSISMSMDKQKILTRQNECLLTTAQVVFSNLEDMSILAMNIIKEAKRLVQCEICVLFVIDKENTEMIAYAVENEVLDLPDVVNETRLPQNKGIIGAVANSANLVCLANPMDNPNYDKTVDNLMNKKLRNVLCVPIRDKSGTIGVAQFCNKLEFGRFHERDEQAAISFCVYCSTSISHCLLYRRLQEAHRRSNMASELMLYHTQKIAEEDVLRLSLCNIPRPSALSEEFCKFSFIPRSIPIHDTIVACMSMFDDLGFIQKYRIKRKTLSRFLLLVEKGYRDVPYHNWSHAFAVAHFCYLLLKLLPLNKYLTDLERLSLFVACLCHDIDHRGTTNSFQVQSKTMLAQLYSSEGSVLERHHFAQTMCILNIENCNIFDALTAQEYQRVLDNMRDVILATDIAQHLRLRKGMEQIAADGYKFESKNDHYLISCLMITACDLSDQTKKWSASKHIAGQIYAEFFSQGDLERAMGNTPNLMMDRERACIPKLQIDFLDTIALPCYKLLSKLFADSQTVYATIYHSRRCWVMLHKILRQTHSSHSKCNLDVLHDKDLEDEVLRVVGPVEILSPDEVILTEKEIC